nr:hypothetical protein Iba_chr10aCG8820 [Ipomoea batatas]
MQDGTPGTSGISSKPNNSDLLREAAIWRPGGSVYTLMKIDQAGGQIATEDLRTAIMLYGGSTWPIQEAKPKSKRPASFYLACLEGSRGCLTLSDDRGQWLKVRTRLPPYLLSERHCFGLLCDDCPKAEAFSVKARLKGNLFPVPVEGSLVRPPSSPTWLCEAALLKKETICLAISCGYKLLLIKMINLEGFQLAFIIAENFSVDLVGLNRLKLSRLHMFLCAPEFCADHLLTSVQSRWLPCPSCIRLLQGTNAASPWGSSSRGS